MGLVEREGVGYLLRRQIVVGRDLDGIHVPDLPRDHNRLDADSGAPEDGLWPTRGTATVGDVGEPRIVEGLLQAADLLSERPDDELVEGDPLPARQLLGVLLELSWKIQCGRCHGGSILSLLCQIRRPRPAAPHHPGWGVRVLRYGTPCPPPFRGAVEEGIPWPRPPSTPTSCMKYGDCCRPRSGWRASASSRPRRRRTSSSTCGRPISPYSPASRRRRSAARGSGCWLPTTRPTCSRRRGRRSAPR